MTIEAIIISFIGVDERSKSAYKLFFESYKPVRYVISDDYRKAQLCLIDKDAYNIQIKYQDLVNNYPEKYILMLSIVDHVCNCKREFFLKKPIKRDDLQVMLSKIHGLISCATVVTKVNVPTSAQIKQAVRAVSQDYIKKASNIACSKPVGQGKQIKNTITNGNKKSQKKTGAANAGKLVKIEHEEYFVGECPDIDVNNLEQLKNIYYEPTMLLQEIIAKACDKSQKSGEIVQLNIINNIFYFDTKAQKVYSAVSLAVIRPLCVVQHDNKVSYSVKHDSFREDINFIANDKKNKLEGLKQEHHIWDMQAFIWLIALWCSRGRVPQGMDLSKPVYLECWPNLTRLEAIPHAIRIAAFIYEQPCTLTDVAKKLVIEQRYVFAFFSACQAIGISAISMRDVDGLFVSEKPESHKNKFILSKLLGRLVNFSRRDSLSETA